jgi:hypothetical protein
MDKPNVTSNLPNLKMLTWTGPDYRVRMAADWCCPSCFRPLRPPAVRHDGAVWRLICELCHVELQTIEPLEQAGIIEQLEGRP